MKYCKKANNIKDTEKIAFEVAQFCKDKKRVAILLTGGLGAGKTTFTKYFANFFGCFDNFSSPTFTILNTYENNDIKILHFDLYRIDSLSELEQSGFFEYIEDEAIVIIEWADKLNLKEFFENIIEINIKTDNKKRIFEINI